MERSVDFSLATVYGNNNGAGNEIRIPLTSWASCTGLASARGILELRAMSNTDLEVMLCLEFADYPDQDGTLDMITLGAWQSTEGIHYPTVWNTISAKTDQNQLFRVCVEVRRKTGTGLEMCRVAGRVELKSA
jgi:hypothetical protein